MDEEEEEDDDDGMKELADAAEACLPVPLGLPRLHVGPDGEFCPFSGFTRVGGVGRVCAALARLDRIGIGDVGLEWETAKLS